MSAAFLQNVPVKFVGVNVPAPPPVQYVGQPVEITPQYGGVYHHSGQYLRLGSHFKGLDKVAPPRIRIKISPSTKFSVRGREHLHKPAPVRGRRLLQSRCCCNLCQIKFYFLAFACHPHTTPRSPVIQLYLHNTHTHNCITLLQIPSTPLRVIPP